MKTLLLRLFVALSCLALLTGATIYRHVDSDGNVTFSDQPSDGAEAMDIGSPSSYRSPPSPTPRERQPRERETEQEPEAVYEQVRIISPADESTVRDNQGLVTVRAETRPGLRQGHRLAVLVNGEQRGEPQRSYSFTVDEIHRGEHTIQVRVIDRDGQSVAESAPHTIYMHQASRLFQNRQGPPGTGINPGPAP